MKRLNLTDVLLFTHPRNTSSGAVEPVVPKPVLPTLVRFLCIGSFLDCTVARPVEWCLGINDVKSFTLHGKTGIIENTAVILARWLLDHHQKSKGGPPTLHLAKDLASHQFLTLVGSQSQGSKKFRTNSSSKHKNQIESH